MMFVNLADTGLTKTMMLNHLNPWSSIQIRNNGLITRIFSIVNILTLEVDEICLHQFNNCAEAAS